MQPQHHSHTHDDAHAHAHDDAHAYKHAHTHTHTHTHPAALSQEVRTEAQDLTSPVLIGVLQRTLWSVGLIAVLWLVVLWALR